MKVLPVLTGKRILFAAALVLIALYAAVGTAQAATYGWQVNSQHVTLYISNSSSDVYMVYNVDAKINSNSDPWNEVWIPATTDNMQIVSVVDSTGTSHSSYIDRADHQIKTQGWNLRANDHVNLTIESILPGFIFQSNKPGYDIVQFIPPWWDMTIRDTRVEYVLPAEIPTGEVLTGNREYNGIGNYSDIKRTLYSLTAPTWATTSSSIRRSASLTRTCSLES
jgi:hypothetical protein